MNAKLLGGCCCCLKGGVFLEDGLEVVFGSSDNGCFCGIGNVFHGWIFGMIVVVVAFVVIGRIAIISSVCCIIVSGRRRIILQLFLLFRTAFSTVAQLCRREIIWITLLWNGLFAITFLFHVVCVRVIFFWRVGSTLPFVFICFFE